MKFNAFDNKLRPAIVGLAVFFGNGAVNIAQKSCDCGEPPQGKVTCENNQEPFCVVKNGKVDARCRSSRGKYGAALQREVLEEALGRPLTDAEWQNAQLQAGLAKGEASLKDAEGKELFVKMRPTSEFENLPHLEPLRFAPSGSYPLDQIAILHPSYRILPDSFHGGAELNLRLGVTYASSNVVSSNIVSYSTAGLFYDKGGRILYYPTRPYPDYGFSQYIIRGSSDFIEPSPPEAFYVLTEPNSDYAMPFNLRSRSNSYERFQFHTSYTFGPPRTAGDRTSQISGNYELSVQWPFAPVFRPVETVRHSRLWWWKDSLLGLPCTMCVERTLQGQVCEDFSARSKAEVKAQTEKMCQGDFLCARKQPTITCK